MAEIVNLRQARKQKARADKERAAAGNRAAYGRTKDERERQRRLDEQAGRFIDGHLREPAPDET
ncbi:DUF4169 family protein [Mesorhizobium sp. 8]|uniref:DUF4169 family protein n=1 Tax=Mesorhizobium sp. 8 TaxID=2584466 RepID=UPI0011244C58|nr:DUF4169 family protein [Mesorhizobium sp. 8]QDC00008.1 DUF4169 family protein [Mesorhizobium sp. 8]